MQFALRSVTLVALFCFLAASVFSQTNFFTTVQSGDLPKSVSPLKKVKSIQTFRLDEAAMRNYLLGAPLEFHNNGATLALEIPLPDGTTEVFGIVESPVLSPEMAAQHPEIKTYCGNGLTHKKAIIRLSLTSSGFNAVLLNIGSDAVYFEKHLAGADLYFNYFTREAIVPPGGLSSRCGVSPDYDNDKPLPTLNGVSDRNNTGGMLRTYRLAMAANGEFTVLHGGTQTSGYDAVVAYVNRMDAFYRNELSVHFILVSGTNLIYTDPTMDPYDNSNQSLMLTQNHNNCNTVIGSANYDIGHVWGYVGGSGGGIAAFTALCDGSIKGEGVSGEGDLSFYAQVFMDQLLFHEVGHQFGMSHSYNSNIPVCTTYNPGTAVEPGSGTTIMSYGFTCGADDYFETGQPYTGPVLQFHTVSYTQANDYILNTNPGYGGSCVVLTSTGNTPPVVTMPNAYTIPISTPFALTGSATDANGNGLTYCWEGTNISTTAPDPTILANTAEPPFFRTYGLLDSSFATRTYPLLSAILDGSNYAKGDKLPSVGIETTHNLTVRDNNAAGGGVSFGSVTITVDGTKGPFLITSNFSVALPALSVQIVTWSVNNTAGTTPNVKISLSTDGGLTFPTVLAASTPNDGSEVIILPNTLTTTARIKVEAIGNIFFDISNNNFEISAALPVDLLSFDVSLKNKNAAYLQWQTTSEINTDGYEIEMGQDNSNFRKLGFVKGRGTASGYDFDVPNLAPGTYYFRLKMMDVNGDFKYSPVKSLTVRQAFSATVSPNPVQDELVVTIAQDESSSVTISLINALGQTMQLRTSGETVKGDSTWRFDIANLPAGIYYCVCKTDNGLEQTVRVVKK